MITYIFKSSLSLIILFGLYWFLLRREKIFIFNRFFLIFSILFSLLVPFISFPVTFRINPPLYNMIPAHNFVIPEINPTSDLLVNDVTISQPYTGDQHQPINISAILIALYISGVILFLFRFLRNINIIIRKTRISEKIKLKGYRIVLDNDMTDPCCFFNYIFLNRNDYLNGRIENELLKHEMEHLRQSHTLDVILIELVKIFYWFNPIHVLYDRAIRINHEYLADAGVISDRSEIKSYTDILLSYITGRKITLASSSNHSFTRLRLKMIMKPGAGSFSYGVRIAMTLSLSSLFFLSISFKESFEQVVQPDTTENGTEVTQSIVRGIVLSEEGNPLNGATIICMISKHASSGVTVGPDGRFVINNVQAGNSLIIGCFGYKTQTINPDFDSEMTIKLTKEPNFPEIRDIRFRNPDFTATKTLVAINGVILDDEGTLKVNPVEIASFNILKDKEATSKYGDSGKDGVLEIVLSDSNPGSDMKKRAEGAAFDTSKYITRLSVNNVSNKGELIDIPLSNLQSASVWTYHNTPAKNRKELRTIVIMTRDFYRVKGTVVNKNEKPLSGVSITVSGNPSKEISDKNGRFEIEDVMTNALLEFSHDGYKPYYLATGGAVFTTELTIDLEKKKKREEDDVYETAEIMPQYPGGEMKLRQFIAKNINYPEAAIAQRAEGVVIVRFVVNTRGNIEDVELLQKVHPAIDTEVLRIIGKLDRFVPGSQRGKLVDVYYTLPITFSVPKTSTPQ